MSRTPTSRARPAPASWMSSKVNISSPTGLNSRWNSTAAAAVSPTVTASSETSQNPADRIAARPMNSLRLTRPPKRVNRWNTPISRSRALADRVASWARCCFSSRYACTVRTPCMLSTSTCERSATAARSPA